MVLHRSRSRRVLVGGLAMLLAPVLITACGPTPEPHQDAARAGSATATPTPAAPLTAGEAPSQAPTPTPSASGSTAQQTHTPAPAPATTQPAPVPVGGALTLIHSTASGGRTVALTFDDGPGPATPRILDLLAQYGAKATFCEIGPQAAADPAIVHRILAEGHRLCDHTVHHPQPMHTLAHDRQVYEIAAAKSMITTAGGPGTRVAWFRAPGGDFTTENEQIAAENGMRSLSWSVDPRDWSRPGAPAILATIQRTLRPGGVVLMHDGGGDRSQTVAALAQLLPWLVSQGYTFDFPAA